MENPIGCGLASQGSQCCSKQELTPDIALTSTCVLWLCMHTYYTRKHMHTHTHPHTKQERVLCVQLY